MLSLFPSSSSSSLGLEQILSTNITNLLYLFYDHYLHSYYHQQLCTRITTANSGFIFAKVYNIYLYVFPSSAFIFIFILFILFTLFPYFIYTLLSNYVLRIPNLQLYSPPCPHQSPLVKPMLRSASSTSSATFLANFEQSFGSLLPEALGEAYTSLERHEMARQEQAPGTTLLRILMGSLL